jgi:hypothetical protein
VNRFSKLPPMKSGVGTEFLYLKGDNVTGHGEFIETMENGDKNVYKYEFSGTMKNGAFESGSNPRGPECLRQYPRIVGGLTRCLGGFRPH